MKVILIFLLLLIVFTGKGQPEPLNEKLADSLIRVLPSLPNNRTKVDGLNKLARMFTGSDNKGAIGFATEAIHIARKLDYRDGLISGLAQSGFIKATISEWPQSMYELNEAMQNLDENDQRMMLLSSFMFVNFSTKGEHEEALKWANRTLRHPLFSTIPESDRWVNYAQTGMAYDGLDQIDSARKYANKCIPLIKQYGSTVPSLKYLSLSLLGSIALKDGHFQEALSYFRQADNYGGIAKVFDSQNQVDSAIHYGKLGLGNAQLLNSEENIQLASSLLAKNFEAKSQKEANEYLKIFIESRERQFNSEKLKQLEAIKLEEQSRVFKAEQSITAQRNLLVVSSIVGITFLVVGFLVFFIRSNKVIKITNRNLSKTLNELKSTQSQLIQSEKMASLGELTAGIAHEIQNPLNFVNNFSEVSTELVDEMNAEIEKGNLKDAKEIGNDLKQNLEKINHHGKRAGDIVKGMLQHSRSSSGIKEPTDINALADEYLRLAYHGLRAKDKSFSATMKTEFDETIGSINIIPQDIGRVILNLITNAFYAVSEKSKVESSKLDSRYEPTVTVSTHRSLSSGEGRGEVIIKVKDNGNGIPDSIKEKIFQPFFTTKPTGQGTGLGLSLSYDIVKAHGGELKVETEVLQAGLTFTSFIVTIPSNKPQME